LQVVFTIQFARSLYKAFQPEPGKNYSTQRFQIRRALEKIPARGDKSVFDREDCPEYKTVL
jgi:hypothetical protein